MLFITCALIVTLTLPQAADAELLGNIKALGVVDKSERLFDGVIDRNNFAELDMKDPSARTLSLLLEKTSSIRSVKIHFVEPVPSMTAVLEFSSDLFNWEKIRTVAVKSKPGKATRLVEIPAAGRTALFIRIGFKVTSSRPLKISEIQVDRDPAASVKNVRVNLVSAAENSLTVELESDADIIGSVKYGETLSSLADGPVIANYGREHQVTVAGLLKGTEYYVVGVGQDCNGNMKYSEPARFRTSGIPLPRFGSIDIAAITSGTAACSFTANVDARCSVAVGYAADSLTKYEDAAFGLKHGLFFTNLMQEKNFFFRIGIEDRLGNRKDSELLTAKTLPANLGKNALISGDFKYTGESIAPDFSETAMACLVDGKYSYLDGSAMSGDVFSSDQTVVFNLEGVRPVSRVDVIWWALAYGTDCSLYTALDGLNWTLVGESAAPDPGIRYDFIANIPYIVTRIPVGLKTGFIKLVFKQGQFRARFPQYRNLRILEVLIVPDEGSRGEIKVRFD